VTDLVRELLAAYDVVTDPASDKAARRQAGRVFSELDNMSEREADAYYAGVRARRAARIAAEPPSWTMEDLYRAYTGEEVAPNGQAPLFPEVA
jgi:hypothetical protein